MPDIPHPSRTTWGKIVANGVADYQITTRDACTVAISSQFEDRTAPQYIIWCYVQRKMAGTWVNKTFHETVMFHSQPINPVWAWPDNWNSVAANGGANYRSAWNRVNRYWLKVQRGEPVHQSWTTGFEQSRIEARRTRISKISRLVQGDEAEWARVPQNIKAAVYMILTGQVGNVCPGFTDFAAGTLQSIRNWTGRKAQLGGAPGRGNFFISSPPLPSGRTVHILSPDGTSSINKRIRSFPSSGGSDLGDFDTSFVSDESQIAQINQRSEDSQEASSSSTQPGPSQNNILVTADGVPNAQETVQRYSHMDRRRLMTYIDNWAEEIEDLLTTVDPV